MQRVELDVDSQEKEENGDPNRRYELHLYECYWAPMTEGVAKLKDVVSFLLDGGSRGLINSMKSFQRAMFGGMESFQVPKRTPFWILSAVVILAALTVVNGVIVAAGAARTKLPVLAATHLDTYWPQLTALASWMTAVAFTLGTVLYLAELSKPGQSSKGGPGKGARRASPFKIPVVVLVLAALIGTIGVIAFTAFVMGWTTLGWHAWKWFAGMHWAQVQATATTVIFACLALVVLGWAWRSYLVSSEQQLRGDATLRVFFVLAYLLHFVSVAVPIRILFFKPFSQKLPAGLEILYSTVWVWPFLIALSAQIRTILVEYMGDVAIYVTPSKLDRFDEVRDAIKQRARDIVSAVYLACEPGSNRFLYDQVAMVGHSLGSVIAYDTLNALMLDDWLTGNFQGIANRTNSLLTFGSPLDKTAFLFTIQATHSLRIRERLAATVQPLIESYPKFRKFPWINVYSLSDIISGKLIFYDLKSVQAKKPLPLEAVHNMKDPDAYVPLLAHVDYWKNSFLWERLLEQIAP